MDSSRTPNHSWQAPKAPSHRRAGTSNLQRTNEMLRLNGTIQSIGQQGCITESLTELRELSDAC